jgi:hypothetical protein
MTDATRRRVPIWPFLVIGTLVVGIAIGVVGGKFASHRIVGSDVSPGPLLVSPDGRTLTGSVGTCASGTLDVTETARTVTVVLHRDPSFMIAPGSCAIESFSAHLRAPLGQRRLVDGITHASLPSFNGSSILHPTELPDGYVHRYDTATLPDENVSGVTGGCIQVYTESDSWDEAIWISQQLGVTWTPPDGVATSPIVVRGHPGLAVPGEIEWTENGELITVQSHTYPYATPPTAELVRIADSLG